MNLRRYQAFHSSTCLGSPYLNASTAPFNDGQVTMYVCSRLVRYLSAHRLFTLVWPLVRAMSLRFSTRPRSDGFSRRRGSPDVFSALQTLSLRSQEATYYRMVVLSPLVAYRRPHPEGRGIRAKAACPRPGNERSARNRGPPSCPHLTAPGRAIKALAARPTRIISTGHHR